MSNDVSDELLLGKEDVAERPQSLEPFATTGFREEPRHDRASLEQPPWPAPQTSNLAPQRHFGLTHNRCLVRRTGSSSTHRRSNRHTLQNHYLAARNPTQSQWLCHRNSVRKNLQNPSPRSRCALLTEQGHIDVGLLSCLRFDGMKNLMMPTTPFLLACRRSRRTATPTRCLMFIGDYARDSRVIESSGSRITMLNLVAKQAIRG